MTTTNKGAVPIIRLAAPDKKVLEVMNKIPEDIRKNLAGSISGPHTDSEHYRLTVSRGPINTSFRLLALICLIGRYAPKTFVEGYAGRLITPMSVDLLYEIYTAYVEQTGVGRRYRTSRAIADNLLWFHHHGILRLSLRSRRWAVSSVNWDQVKSMIDNNASKIPVEWRSVEEAKEEINATAQAIGEHDIEEVHVPAGDTIVLASGQPATIIPRRSAPLTEAERENQALKGKLDRIHRALRLRPWEDPVEVIERLYKYVDDQVFIERNCGG